MKHSQFTAGFLSGVAVCGICMFTTGCRLKHEPGKVGGDDDPIVVAGGSLEVRSNRGFDPDAAVPPDPRKAIHTKRHWSLHRIEVQYHDSGPKKVELVPAKGEVAQVAITYCPAKCADKPGDTVTFSTDSLHQNLVVFNSDSARPIANFNQASKTFAHREREWKIDLITVTGAGPKPLSYICSNGKCQVVLYYGE